MSNYLKFTAFGNLNLLEGQLSKAEVLAKGGLDYEVEKYDFSTRIPTFNIDGRPNGGIVDVAYPYHVGLVRTDTLEQVGVVGIDYGILQNSELLDLCEVWNQGGQARYVAAGCLAGGSRVFVVMDTGHELRLGVEEQDSVKSLFFLSSAHDGSRAVLAYPSPVFMRNGTVLAMAERRHGAIRVKHTKNSRRYLGQAHKLLSKVMDYWNRSASDFVLLRDTPANDVMAMEFLDHVYPGDGPHAQAARDDIFHSFKAGPTSQLPYCCGTLLGLYFACAAYAEEWTRVLPSRRRPADAAARMQSQLIGATAEKKAKALAFCLRLQRDFQTSIG